MSMLSTDPIADMLTRIRNAASVGKTEITLPHSKIKETIARRLVKAGYLKEVSVIDAKPQPTLAITINEAGQNSVITEITRLSKPGRRVYARASEIPRVKNGRGIVLVSTSQGVMTGQEASKARLGGELILKIY
jgi:small subunit ribosomal protein S8